MELVYDSLHFQRGISLSILSPRKIPALFRLFEKAGGDLTLSQTKNYAKDPRHLVLLKGFRYGYLRCAITVWIHLNCNSFQSKRATFESRSAYVWQCIGCQSAFPSDRPTEQCRWHDESAADTISSQLVFAH